MCVLNALVFIQGALNACLPAEAFIECSSRKPPLNTLFHKIEDICCITYDDLDNYLNLILHLAEHKPLCIRLSPSREKDWKHMYIGSMYAHGEWFTLCGPGDYTLGSFQLAFSRLDEACEYKLSHRKNRRQHKKWALDDPRPHF